MGEGWGRNNRISIRLCDVCTKFKVVVKIRMIMVEVPIQKPTRKRWRFMDSLNNSANNYS